MPAALAAEKYVVPFGGALGLIHFAAPSRSTAPPKTPPPAAPS